MEPVRMKILTIFFSLWILTEVQADTTVKKTPSKPAVKTAVKTQLKPTPSPSSAPIPAIPDRIMKYRELENPDGPILYTQKVQFEVLPDGKFNIRSTVTDPKGGLIYHETIVAQGSSPLSHVADVQQTKRHLEMEVKEDRVLFRTRALTSDNPEKPEEDDDKLPENLIAGPLAETFIAENFDKIMEGETVHAKMGILEIRELVSFKFWKKEQTKFNNRDVVVVAMKPASIFVSLIVNTIYFYIDPKDKKMVRYIGRTPLWKEVNGELKALDADLLVE